VVGLATIPKAAVAATPVSTTADASAGETSPGLCTGRAGFRGSILADGGDHRLLCGRQAAAHDLHDCGFPLDLGHVRSLTGSDCDAAPLGWSVREGVESKG